MLDVDDDLLHGDFEAGGHGLDDAYVGLVGHDVGDVLARESVALADLGGEVTHVGDGELVDGAPLLVYVVHTVVNGEVGGRAHAASGLHAEEGQALAVGAQYAVAPSEVFGCGFDEHGCGSVAEQGAGGAVGVVDDAGHLLGAAHDDALVASALYHRRGLVHGEDEAAAGAPEVEAEGVGETQAPDDDAGGASLLIQFFSINFSIFSLIC